jgi:dTDP-4-dehydrorhamnose reductase
MPYLSFQLLDQSKSILVFGRDGQVGKAECDLADEESIFKALDHYRPQVIINAAAYTMVDQAENQFELAFAINARAPQVMAAYMASIPGGIFLHYSSDYVFADSKVTPYVESDSTGPIGELNVYGQTKLGGEQLIQEVFAVAQQKDSLQDSIDERPKYFILRTSWLYGDGDNFIKTILRLASEQDQIKVVSDQMGVPTCANWLAEVSVKIINSNAQPGLYHVVPDGETSWHSLAVLAIEAAIGQGASLVMRPENVLPASAKESKVRVKRPYNSRMNNSKLKKALSNTLDIKIYPHWQAQVKSYVQENIAQLLKVGTADEGRLCQ